jgi:hypothetical protein
MFCPLSIDWGNVAQWVSGIAASGVIIYALYRDNISHHWKKPKIKFIKVIKNFQGNICIYRLVIKNDSNYIAKNVEIDIEEVIDDDGNKRDNFLPAPHNWTHIDKPLRDIFPHQIAYLDILTINEVPNQFIALYTRILWFIPNMTIIKPGTTILKFKYYTENGQTGNINLQVKWKGKETFDENDLPEIKIIQN